jgi:hypothetical protein
VAQSCLSFVNNLVGPTDTLLDRMAVVDRRWDLGRKGPTVEVTVTEETDMFVCLIFFFCVYLEKDVLLCCYLYLLASLTLSWTVVLLQIFYLHIIKV